MTRTPRFETAHGMRIESQRASMAEGSASCTSNLRSARAAAGCGHAQRQHAAAVRTLRTLAPETLVDEAEARALAERQASLLIHLLGVTEPPVATATLSNLPRLSVERVTSMPMSGSAQWVAGRWHVLLNASEASTRQRFTLAHELKHIIDHPDVSRLYRAIDSRTRAAAIERCCDFFAGCLLVPSPWLRLAWRSGSREAFRLADLFDVSPAAIHVRLAQTGLLGQRIDGRARRHGPPTRTLY